MPYMWLMLGTGIFGACVIVRAGNQYLYPSLVIYGREWVEPKQFSLLHVESKSRNLTPCKESCTASCYTPLSVTYFPEKEGD